MKFNRKIYLGVSQKSPAMYVFFLKSSGIYAFVILKDGVSDSDEEMAKSLKQLVKKKIGSFAVPQLVMVCTVLCRLSCKYFVHVEVW